MKDFVPYEEALAMREMGFDDPCFAVYRGGSLYGMGTSVSGYHEDGSWKLEKNSDYGGIDTFVVAPTYQQAFKWFRDEHKLFGCIDLHVCTPAHWYIRVDDIVENDTLYHSIDENIRHESYDAAELPCLQKLIHLVKTRNELK